MFRLFGLRDDSLVASQPFWNASLTRIARGTSRGFAARPALQRSIEKPVKRKTRSRAPGSVGLRGVSGVAGVTRQLIAGEQISWS